MDIEVQPLTVQEVNWQPFINACKGVLGKSPTRGLDSAGIDTKSPKAFLGVADFKNHPLDNIRNGGVTNNTYSLIHFGFFAIVPDWLIAEIATVTTLTLQSSDNGRTEILIMAGTLKDWRSSVISGCGDQRSPECRTVFNKIYEHYKLIGLRDVWKEYETFPFSDGTFVLLCR
jgi:hypothetical protein